MVLALARRWTQGPLALAVARVSQRTVKGTRNLSQIRRRTTGDLIRGTASAEAFASAWAQREGVFPLAPGSRSAARLRLPTMGTPIGPTGI
jgi:hypothetical protein